MKKILVGAAIFFVFIAYALFERRGNTLSLSTNVNNNTDTTNTNINNPSGAPSPTSSNQKKQGTYKDGTYTGNTEDAFYGNVQIQVTISNGKITDVQFLQYPNDRRESMQISNYAMPSLKQEAIQAQIANVDIVTGATQTSQAFIDSLTSALSQAQ